MEVISDRIKLKFRCSSKGTIHSIGRISSDGLLILITEIVYPIPQMSLIKSSIWTGIDCVSIAFAEEHSEKVIFFFGKINYLILVYDLKESVLVLNTKLNDVSKNTTPITDMTGFTIGESTFVASLSNESVLIYEKKSK